MGLFFRPRRPLMRLAAGAATTTVAYQAGKRGVEPDDNDDQTQAPHLVTDAAPPMGPAAAPADSTAELERLAALHASGALTDEEFTAAKARVLGL